jgi:hypothetical protein
VEQVFQLLWPHQGWNLWSVHSYRALCLEGPCSAVAILKFFVCLFLCFNKTAYIRA